MVTRNELAFDIFETLRSHIGDDDDIDIRQLESYVKDYRADFLKQRFSKNPFDIDESSIQTLTQLELEKVDSSSVINIPSGRYLMRTKKSIPDTIRRFGDVGTLLHIGPADMLDKSFTITTYNKAIDSGHNRFTLNEIFAFPYNGYIYMLSNGDYFKSLYYINIRGVFSDPALAYLVTSQTALYSGNENYYTPRDLKRYIISSIIKDKFNIIINPPVDNQDDGMHELKK